MCDLDESVPMELDSGDIISVLTKEFKKLTDYVKIDPGGRTFLGSCGKNMLKFDYRYKPGKGLIKCKRVKNTQLLIVENGTLPLKKRKIEFR